MSKSLWYAEGLRWIGSLFNGAADHFERAATTVVRLDPHYRCHPGEKYLDEVRTRAHIQF
jgi:hypothetical protein